MSQIYQYTDEDGDQLIVRRIDGGYGFTASTRDDAILVEVSDMGARRLAEILAEPVEAERSAAMKRELTELRGLVDAYIDAPPNSAACDQAWFDLRTAVEHRRAVEKRLDEGQPVT